MSKRKGIRPRKKPQPEPAPSAEGAEAPQPDDKQLRHLFFMGFLGATLGGLLGFGAVYGIQWLRLGGKMGIWGLVPAMFLGSPAGAVMGAMIATVLTARRMPKEGEGN